MIFLQGTNACYFEHLDNVPKWKEQHDDLTKELIVNTEWGALGKVRKEESLLVSIKSCIFICFRMVV